MTLLQRISSPADLKQLDADQLPKLAQEVREFLIDKVSRTGGHLGPNLEDKLSPRPRPQYSLSHSLSDHLPS